MRLAAFLLFATAALVLGAPAAAAHANYYSSDPPRGARLQSAPSEVQVTLSEAIDPQGSGLQVEDTQGQRVDEGDVRVESGANPVLRVGLREGLVPGVYKASWRALSTVDGHVTSGSWRFAVGNYTVTDEAEAAEGPEWPSAASRTLAYVGYAMAFGALAFRFWIEPRPAFPGRDRAIARALLLGALLAEAGVGAVGLLTLRETGLGAAAFLKTQVGRWFVYRLLAGAAAAAAAAWAVSRPAARGPPILAAFFMLAAAWGNSMFVHSANQGLHAVATDFVHLVSVATWLGGLALFLRFVSQAARQGSFEDVLAHGRRFASMALLCVILLGVSGLVSTVLVLGAATGLRPWTWLDSPYGAILAGKVALFALMVAVAGVNRFVFLRPSAQPGPLARRIPAPGAARSRLFGRFILLEAAMGLAVLGLAGLLTAISPPSEEAPTAPMDLEASGTGRDFETHLWMKPAPSAGGTSNVSLTVSRVSDGSPLTEAVRVRVTIAEASDNGTGGESWTARHVGSGRWLVGDVLFAAAGAYEARIEIQTEDVYRDTVRVAFNVTEETAGFEAAREEHVYLHENPFHVAPERIELRPQEPLLLRVSNAGKSVHDLVVCPTPVTDPQCPGAPGRTPLLPAGATFELRLALTPGTYEYYCSIPGHREAGMKGTIVVDPGGGAAPLAPTWALLALVGALAWVRRRA